MFGSWIKKPSAKFSIAFGQVSLLVSLILVAAQIGLIPDRKGALREGRATLAEALAFNSTAFITRSDLRRMEAGLNFAVERNTELLSAAVRRINGKIMVSAGDEHELKWIDTLEGKSTESQIQVPLKAGDKEWGSLELRFIVTENKVWWNFIYNPLVQIIIFLALTAFLVFYFYLGKMLKQLDPSQAIPDRVRSALDTMAEGLLVLDRKGSIVLANEAFATLVDSSPAELMGLNAVRFDWTDTEDKALDVTETPWYLSLEQGAAQMNQMVRLHVPNGSDITFMVNCSPVMGSGDKAAGVLISFDDVTELEKKEIELKNSKNEAEAANKAKSDFLANMSHEIRTPMNAILGFTDVLRRGYGKGKQENSAHYLETIHRSGSHLLGLINDILDLSKVEAGQLEIEEIQCAPHKIIMELVNVLGVNAKEKGISLEFETDGPLPETIQSDPVRIRQIVTNLIGNAIKFTEQGGVKVVARISESKETPQMEIDIIDTGIGMTKPQAESIFSPFVQADSSITRRFGGTGLGLSISLKFAHLLGGDIIVLSEPGKGSTFRVTINTGSLEGIRLLTEEEILRVNDDQSDEGEVQWMFPPAHVLIVDDGQENRELFTLVLEELGLIVDNAENGEVAVSLASQNHYDAILMDVQMPVMDGFTATEILRQQGLKQPIVALTGNAMKGFEEECIAVGFTAYMAKPIQIDALIKLLAGLLNGKQVPVSQQNVALQNEETIEVITPSTSGLIYSRLATSKKYHPIIKNFVERLTEKMQEMDHAWSKRDYKALSHLAHWLKGAGGSVGFDVLNTPSKNLELAARQSDELLVQASLEEIHELIPRLSTGTMETELKSAGNDVDSTPVTQVRQLEENQAPVVSRLAKFKKFQPIVSSFVARMDEKVQAMESALETSDFSTLADLAHWLKGAGGSVGFDDLTEPAKALEKAAQAKSKNEANNLVVELRGLADRLVDPK